MRNKIFLKKTDEKIKTITRDSTAINHTICSGNLRTNKCKIMWDKFQNSSTIVPSAQDYHLYSCTKEHYVFDRAIEVDESYFGRRRKGKRGRGASGKTIVF